MIFVVGGAYQGKETFARKLAGERFGERPFGVVDCGQERIGFSRMEEHPAGLPGWENLLLVRRFPAVSF